MIRPLIENHRIKARIREVARQISEDYRGKNPILLCVLNGAATFLHYLREEMDWPVPVENIRVSSYQGTKSTGALTVVQDVTGDLKGRDILIVEDIVDTGLTLKFLKEHVTAKGAASIRVCTLLKKDLPGSGHPLDYVGFTVPDEFVVGFGMDADGLYRELDFIGVLT